MTFIVRITILLLILITVSCKKEPKNTTIQLPPNNNSPALPPRQLKLSHIPRGFDIPWGIIELPDGRLIVTERPGYLSIVDTNGLAKFSVMYMVSQNTEGGLLGLCLDPNFNTNHYIYMYYTNPSTTISKVLRLVYSNDAINSDKTIVDSIPAGNNHDGGALAFGPDGYLYIGTGDATNMNLPQDLNSLGGKILRVDRDGKPAPGNPFNTRIWTYGHRNVQGFVWTRTGTMIATEHGPTIEKGWCCHDEINLIRPGNNYGWPDYIAGTETGTITAPLIHSGNETWAPSGCAYMDSTGFWPNSIIVGALKSKQILRFQLNSACNAIVGRSDTLTNRFGRIRQMIWTPSKRLIFSTSNNQGQFPPVDSIFVLK